ncbi:MAG: hypothetical protein KF830_01390 [Planctomycetes bacterium]|nr:hypothetical protein [Planctomycetota bacterium]
MLSSAILLGPQRHVPIVREAVAALVARDDRRPLAAVTAGWEERESEDQELREHVQRPVVNLEVWGRVERIFERDRDLLLAMRERHDRLRAVQELYRLRLGGLIEPMRELMRRAGDEALLAPEREDAMAMVKVLDEQHQRRVAAIHAEFEDRHRPGERAAVQRERRDLQRWLASSSCLLVAGGHVSVLLHRLRLFDLFGLYGDRPVIAWSAGAMVLTERIVLFHDDPPQGSAHAEVMEAGFGLVRGLVALPHARHRLQTGDAERVQLMAQRFAPAVCALLDKGARLDWRAGRWQPAPGTRQLTTAGGTAEVGT